MEKQPEIALFETTLTFWQKLLIALQIGLGFLGLVYVESMYANANWGFQLFICCFFGVWIVQAIRLTKTFHLYPDRLVIKRPFLFTAKTDHTFKIEDLKEVIFRRVKGRFGGPFLIVKARRFNDSFRIDFGKEIVDEFIDQLSNLGVKSSSENM